MLVRFYYVIDITDPEQIYVGSTTKTLQERLISHWKGRNNKKCYSMLATYMKDKQQSDFEIFLIEERECATKSEQLQQEDEWIQQMGLMNKRRAVFIYNPELKSQYDKEYFEKNRERKYAQSKEWKRQWRLKNKC
jgi:Uri superfamily endonuclease